MVVVLGFNLLGTILFRCDVRTVLVVMHRGPIRKRFVETWTNQKAGLEFPPKCSLQYANLLSITLLWDPRARSSLALWGSCPKCPKCGELDFQRALPPWKAGQIKDTSHGLKLMTIKKVIGLQSKIPQKSHPVYFTGFILLQLHGKKFNYWVWQSADLLLSFIKQWHT